MKTEVLIIGGGLVGAACAIALHQQGLQVVLVDSKPAPNLPTNDWDARIYAITPGNAQWLYSLGVWQSLDKARINPIDAMHIFDGGREVALAFDAFTENLDNLGWIVESSQLEHALWQAMQAVGIGVRSNVHGQSLRFDGQYATLTLADGSELVADLVVGADGANSWVRQQAGIAVTTRPYGQMGVVGNFACEKPHGNVARQWFDKQGILAWLPMAGNRISIVWSTNEAHARALLEKDMTTLAREVAQAGGELLGEFMTITPAQAFPLNARFVERLVQPNLTLVGDAAHQVHPMAGQGVNLGFRDVMSLCNTLRQKKPLQPLGDVALLRSYERARKSDILSMQGLTLGLDWLFDAKHEKLKTAAKQGMRVLQRLDVAKKFLIRQAVS